MDPAYGKHYSDLYRRHWWWRAREEALLEVLRRRAGSHRMHILDVGCGDGLFFDRLSEFGEVKGVEPDADLVEPSGKHSDRITRVPFDSRFRTDRPFDLILMLDVLEHLDDPTAALRCTHELLTDDGSLLVTVPAFNILWTNHDDLNRHRVRYKRGTLFPLLEQAEFSVVESRYWYQWLAPVKFAVHIAEKVAISKASVPHVPRPWINRTLYHLSRIEQKVLAPARVPFGSSLMVYCRKFRVQPAARE